MRSATPWDDDFSPVFRVITSWRAKVDMRARGRQAVVRFESDDDGNISDQLGLAFRVGATRLDLLANGKR